MHPRFSRGGLDEQIQGGDAIPISSGRGEGFDFRFREPLHRASKLPGVPKFVPKDTSIFAVRRPLAHGGVSPERYYKNSSMSNSYDGTGGDAVDQGRLRETV